MVKAKQDLRERGIYLLPNLFTLAALFAGFYAVVVAMRGQFDNASIAIFIAMLMDSLDGRVARLTNTQTPFGAEFDSISDMVSFGIAPALVIYSWSLSSLGKFGWLAAFVFAVAVALRLARFNSGTAKENKRYFQGLPCPAGAGVIAGLVWLGNKYDVSGHAHAVSLFVGILAIFIGWLMVSNFSYRSFKDIDLKGSVPFFSILLVILVFVLISLNPPVALFSVFFLYALSGPLSKFLPKKLKAK